MSSDNSVSSDLNMFVSQDMTYQLIQADDGTYQIVEASTLKESFTQDVADSTESSEDEQCSNSQTDSEQTFQESLNALFNSIQPEETFDVPAQEMETDDRFGDPLDSLLVTLEDKQTPTAPSPSPSLFSDMPHNNPLAKHPFFDDLCDLLQTECKQTTLPNHLFQTLGANLGQVTLEKQCLEIRFQQLDVLFPEQVKELSTRYQYHYAAIEMERMNCVDEQISGVHKTWINSHFDAQILQLIERVKSSLQLLEDSKKPVSNSSWTSGVRHRPTLSRKAVQLMENWYVSNLHHPYPSATVIEAMSLAGSISTEQVKKWFGNKRNRAGNTRTLTEIAKRKHRLRHVSTQQKPHKMIGSLALYM